MSFSLIRLLFTRLNNKNRLRICTAPKVRYSTLTFGAQYLLSLFLCDKYESYFSLVIKINVNESFVLGTKVYLIDKIRMEKLL